MRNLHSITPARSEITSMKSTTDVSVRNTDRRSSLSRGKKTLWNKKTARRAVLLAVMMCIVS